jgi:hypothetical protein
MLRFLPDGWFDALMRPLLLADPAYGLYLEVAAPDWRFAATAVLLLLAMLGRRRWTVLQPNQGMLLLGLMVCFYVWTWVSGNGRYFIWGLLMVGPLVVVAGRQLRATLAMRNTVILGVLLLQFVAVWFSYIPNAWSLRPWSHGPGLALAETPLKTEPAVFLAFTSISYAVLVPQMHPASRWVHLVGQMEVGPEKFEYPAILKVLEAPLPKYAVVRATPLNRDVDLQPTEKARRSLVEKLARQGLKLAAATCEYVRTADAVRAVAAGEARRDEGFWFCPVVREGRIAAPGEARPVAPELDDVFGIVERRCPAFFPPGQARTRRIDGAVERLYAYSEAHLTVADSREVYFRGDRALNATFVATIEDIRAGKFAIDCSHLPGRYLPPWRRD